MVLKNSSRRIVTCRACFSHVEGDVLKGAIGRLTRTYGVMDIIQKKKKDKWKPSLLRCPKIAAHVRAASINTQKAKEFGNQTSYMRYSRSSAIQLALLFAVIQLSSCPGASQLPNGTVATTSAVTRLGLARLGAFVSLGLRGCRRCWLLPVFGGA